MSEDRIPEDPQVLKRFLDAVRELREKRKKEAERERSGSADKWKWENFDTRFPFLKELRKTRSRTKRLPPRYEILNLADKFQATLEETNELLIAARYSIEEPFLKGEELERAVMTGKHVLSYFNLPSMVITQDFNIHRWSDALPPLFGMTSEQLRDTADDDRNILRFIFDTQSSVYKILIIGDDYERWEYLASIVIFWFKCDNLNSRYDGWYKNKRDSLIKYPKFPELWENVDIDYIPTGKYAEIMSNKQFIFELPIPFEIPHLLDTETTLRIRLLQIKYFDKSYPRVVAFMPENRAAKLAFKALGLPIIVDIAEKIIDKTSN